MVNLCLGYGAKPMLRNDRNETPLDVASDSFIRNQLQEEASECLKGGEVRLSTCMCFLYLHSPAVVCIPTCPLDWYKLAIISINAGIVVSSCNGMDCGVICLPCVHREF